MLGLIDAAVTVLDRRLDATARTPVALGLSGGGDSMALLLIAAAWARRRKRPLLAFTVDHRLQADSAAWTAFAGAAARRAGAAWRDLPWGGEKPRTGLPAAARDARHRLLAEAARAAGASVLLLAHTADDVLEGEVMRAGDARALGRLRAWSPSPVWPEGRGVFLCRPLLAAGRQALRLWLDEQGAGWLDDPANDDVRFARARARVALRRREPLSPLDRGGDPVFLGAGLLGDGLLGAGMRGGEVRGDGTGALRISRVDVPVQAEAARRLLSLMIVCASGGERPPRGAALERLRRRLLTERAFIAGLGGARIVAHERQVSVFREAGDFARRPRPAAEAGPAPLAPTQLAQGRTIVWDGRFEIAAETDLSIASLAGLAARLPRAERARLAALPPAARAALPVLLFGGETRLPRPIGDGPARAWSLVEARFAAAAGHIACEGDINPACEGRTAMAHGLQSSYVGDLAQA